MINQLRIYEIFDDTSAAFLARFDAHAARIMNRHGFRILAMWETTADGKPAFAYLLSWQSEEEMKEKWASFMADEEWIDIKRQTVPDKGQLVGDISELILTPTAFSAAL